MVQSLTSLLLRKCSKLHACTLYVVEPWSGGASSVEPNNHHDSKAECSWSSRISATGRKPDDLALPITIPWRIRSLSHPTEPVAAAFTHTSQITLDQVVIGYLSSTSAAPRSQRHVKHRVIASVRPTCWDHANIQLTLGEIRN